MVNARETFRAWQRLSECKELADLIDFTEKIQTRGLHVRSAVKTSRLVET